MRAALWFAALLCLKPALSPGLLAQGSGLGLDFPLTGSARVALWAQVSGRVAVRPGVAFRFWQIERDLEPGGESSNSTITELGVGLDILAGLGPKGRAAPYAGFGGSLAPRWTGGQSQMWWGLRGLAGVRADVVDRVAVYGEVALRYSVYGPLLSGPSGDRDRVLSLEAAPLGVIIYLR